MLEVIVNNILNPATIKTVPFIINEIIKGNHSTYIKTKLDNVFNKFSAPDGMRMSVYCADQAAYHNKDVIEQLYGLYPYMRGYHINDVYDAVCDCWGVPPVKASTKQAFYSSTPSLIGDGEMDAACSPRYMKTIKHYMPNAQCFEFINPGHGVGGKDFYEMTQAFLDNPYQRLTVENPLIISQ